MLCTSESQYATLSNLQCIYKISITELAFLLSSTNSWQQNVVEYMYVALLWLHVCAALQSMLLCKVQCSCMGLLHCKVNLIGDIMYMYFCLLDQYSKHLDLYKSMRSTLLRPGKVVSCQPLSLFACGWVLLFITHCQQMLY